MSLRLFDSSIYPLIKSVLSSTFSVNPPSSTSPSNPSTSTSIPPLSTSAPTSTSNDSPTPLLLSTRHPTYLPSYTTRYTPSTSTSVQIGGSSLTSYLDNYVKHNLLSKQGGSITVLAHAVNVLDDDDSSVKAEGGVAEDGGKGG
ncbi:hypothetical protein TrRE_jg9578, partial [Triparma retinervis]